MFDTTQPWLPLFEGEFQTGPVVRKGRRRVISAPLATCPDHEHRAARWAFLGIASSWALTATEALRLLGEPLSSEAERIERLYGVLGAHRSLLLIAPDPRHRAELLRRKDPVFNKASMLDLMLQEGLSGIAQVRAHLLTQVAR